APSHDGHAHMALTLRLPDHHRRQVFNSILSEAKDLRLHSEGRAMCRVLTPVDAVPPEILRRFAPQDKLGGLQLYPERSEGSPVAQRRRAMCRVLTPVDAVPPEILRRFAPQDKLGGLQLYPERSEGSPVAQRRRAMCRVLSPVDAVPPEILRRFAPQDKLGGR